MNYFERWCLVSSRQYMRSIFTSLSRRRFSIANSCCVCATFSSSLFAVKAGLNIIWLSCALNFLLFSFCWKRSSRLNSGSKYRLRKAHTAQSVFKNSTLGSGFTTWPVSSRLKVGHRLTPFLLILCFPCRTAAAHGLWENSYCSLQQGYLMDMPWHIFCWSKLSGVKLNYICEDRDLCLAELDRWWDW